VDDDGAIPEPVREAWQRALDAWDDSARHDAFVGLVAQHNCFMWAAAHYRAKAGDPIADRQLERLRRAATATMLATATARPSDTKKPYQISIAVLIAFVTIAFIGYMYAVYLREPSRETRPPEAARPVK
jgi:hypothetical protein